MKFISQLRASEHNAHYVGAYEESELEWRRLGAADKSRNLAALLGGDAANIVSVLEVGCVTGAVLQAVKQAGIGQTHVGVDMASPDDHRDPAAAGLDLRVYDGVRLPFADDSFDLVYASHVLEHVPDERGFLAELARVARKLIYIEVPCEIIARTSQAALQTTLNIGHINAYTPATLALTLETSAVEPIRFEVFDHSYGIHAFRRSALKAQAIMAIRQTALKVAPTLATQVFCYHCGALARPRKA